MNTFISDTLDDFLQKKPQLEETVFILPSQRAGIFLKKSLKNKISHGFLPEIIHIEQFIEQISGCKKIDTIQLLFQFYKIYKEVEINHESFDIFSSWAITALQDFNEIDQYLIDAKDLFLYIRDIERLKKWSVKGTFQETKMVQDHHSFIEHLGVYYKALTKSLRDQKIGYQGLLYRESCERVEDYTKKHAGKTFVFIGFNALNTAEEFLIQKFLEKPNNHIYWDLDQLFLDKNHQASYFIKKYINTWKYYEKNPKPKFSTYFSQEKRIEVIGTVKNNMQLKVAGSILEDISNDTKTALILGDESLLSVALTSIPKTEQGVNVTMGYPLKEIPNSSLIRCLFQLFLTQGKLQKTKENLFYYKDVLELIKDSSFQKLQETEEHYLSGIEKHIIDNNITFVSGQVLKDIIKEYPCTQKELIIRLFDRFESISEFLERIIVLITTIKETTNDLEKEYLFRFYNAFLQLQNLNNSYEYFTDLKTLYKFYNQILSKETLSFQGEPLQGLQLMGMLETRVLDFENIIICAVNEGVLPKGGQQNSFIPFDVKTHYKLPTYKEKDAIYSYHFFRLLQRSSNVYLIYNTENDSYGNGEKSRFISQLNLLREDVQHSVITPKVSVKETEILEIEKTPEILNKLKAIAKSGFSPSLIGTYLHNPIELYQKYVLNIRELTDVEETVAANTMGTIVHNTLEELYKPFEGKFLNIEMLQKIEKLVNDTLNAEFTKAFKKGDYTTGKNKLIYEVAKEYVLKLIRLDKEVLTSGNELKIIALEKNLSAIVPIEGIDFELNVKGQADRIDELNGVPRIIDYKTGKVTSPELKISEELILNDYKYAKAIQVMLYAYMFIKSDLYKDQPYVLGGIYSFKNLKEKFISMNFSAPKKRTKDAQITKERIDSFMHQFSQIVLEIFDDSIPLTEKESLFHKK